MFVKSSTTEKFLFVVAGKCYFDVGVRTYVNDVRILTYFFLFPNASQYPCIILFFLF